jgi:hypothetical protein
MKDDDGRIRQTAEKGNKQKEEVRKINQLTCRSEVYAYSKERKRRE